MKISGFSFVRNGISLYYPIVEAIKSILPIVDEFIIAVGEGDKDDETRKRIAGIGDAKVKIIDTQWDEKHYKGGIVNSIQTDIAMKECSGDWLFYLQADEVMHEKYLPAIKARCAELLDEAEVEGMVFGYKHFWGDYDHYHASHGWYKNEVRIVRNRPDIHSWQSAQSFRRFDYYDNPRQKDGHHKLKVARVDAEIYHYGWVRPPHFMQNKRRALDSVHWGAQKAAHFYNNSPDEFDYGPLNLLAEFKGSHPALMADMISRMDWKGKLQFSGKPDPTRERHKHEKMRNRLLSLLEKILLGKELGGFHNYILLDV